MHACESSKLGSLVHPVSSQSYTVYLLQTDIVRIHTLDDFSRTVQIGSDVHAHTDAYVVAHDPHLTFLRSAAHA
jgi:hypothetical protein